MTGVIIQSFIKCHNQTGSAVNDNIYDFTAYQKLSRIGSQLRNRRILLAGTDKADTALIEQAFRRHNYIKHVTDRESLVEAIDHGDYDIVLVSDAIDADSAVETIKSERFSSDDDILFVRIVTDRYAASDPRIPELLSALTSEDLTELITWSQHTDSHHYQKSPDRPG